MVSWVLLGNVLIISPIKECFKRPFKECLAMFVYTQHTRSVHTARTQRTHSVPIRNVIKSPVKECWFVGSY